MGLFSSYSVFHEIAQQLASYHVIPVANTQHGGTDGRAVDGSSDGSLIVSYLGCLEYRNTAFTAFIFSLSRLEGTYAAGLFFRNRSRGSNLWTYRRGNPLKACRPARD